MRRASQRSTWLRVEMWALKESENLQGVQTGAELKPERSRVQNPEDTSRLFIRLEGSRMIRGTAPTERQDVMTPFMSATFFLDS